VGVVKVTDFGIASIIDGAGFDGDGRRPPVGTPAFIAPEQAALLLGLSH
jgi:serine/threonine protein kinase